MGSVHSLPRFGEMQPGTLPATNDALARRCRRYLHNETERLSPSAGNRARYLA